MKKQTLLSLITVIFFFSCGSENDLKLPPKSEATKTTIMVFVNNNANIYPAIRVVYDSSRYVTDTASLKIKKRRFVDTEYYVTFRDTLRLLGKPVLDSLKRPTLKDTTVTVFKKFILVDYNKSTL